MKLLEFANQAQKLNPTWILLGNMPGKTSSTSNFIKRLDKLLKMLFNSEKKEMHLTIKSSRPKVH